MGVLFTRSGLFEPAAKQIVAKANIASGSTIALIKRTKINDWNRINYLFDALIGSIISASCAVWGPRYLDLIERLQCQFFKRILGLPQCTPGYALRVELGRTSMAVNIFKSILGWIAKIMAMGRDRFPGIVFYHLLDDARRPNCIVKYNWVATVIEIFFKPIKESLVWEKPELFLSQDYRENLIDRYKKWSREMDLDRCNSSTTLILYHQLNANAETQRYLILHKIWY